MWGKTKISVNNTTAQSKGSISIAMETVMWIHFTILRDTTIASSGKSHLSALSPNLKSSGYFFFLKNSHCSCLIFLVVLKVINFNFSDVLEHKLQSCLL